MSRARLPPRNVARRVERVSRGSESRATVGTQIVLTVARRDFAFGVLHQACAVWAVREAERVADLVDGDLAEPLGRLRRVLDVAFAAQRRDDAGSPVDGGQAQDAPVFDAPL